MASTTIPPRVPSAQPKPETRPAWLRGATCTSSES